MLGWCNHQQGSATCACQCSSGQDFCSGDRVPGQDQRIIRKAAHQISDDQQSAGAANRPLNWFACYLPRSSSCTVRQHLLKYMFARQASHAGQAAWMDRLLGFYEGMLRDGQVLPASSSIGEAPEQPAISAEVYATVLSGTPVVSTPCYNTGI